MVIKIFQLSLVALGISFDLSLTRIILNWISWSFISCLVFRVILWVWLHLFFLNFFTSRSLYFIIISEFSFEFALFSSVFFHLILDLSTFSFKLFHCRNCRSCLLAYFPLLQIVQTVSSSLQMIHDTILNFSHNLTSLPPPYWFLKWAAFCCCSICFDISSISAFY